MLIKPTFGKWPRKDCSAFQCAADALGDPVTRVIDLYLVVKTLETPRAPHQPDGQVPLVAIQ